MKNVTTAADRNQKIAFFFLRVSILLVLLFIVVILGYIFINGYSALSLEFIFESPKNRMTEGGIFPAIIGSFYLIVGAMLFSIPTGVLTAIYLTEYSRPGKLKWLIEMAISNLAGTPSVVFGLFGLALFVKYLNFGPSLIASALTLGLLVLPVVIRSTQEALEVVPKELKDGSLALGVTKVETIIRVVLPIAAPGIMTGIILGIGRVAGETAPILLTGVAYFHPVLPDSPLSQFMALPYHLYVLATSGTNMEKLEPIQYGTALVLLILVLSLNLIAIFIRQRQRKKMKIGA